MIYTLIDERDPIPCRTTYIEYTSPVKIFINFLRITTEFHWFSLQNSFFFIVLRHQSWGVPFGEPEKLIFLYNIKRSDGLESRAAAEIQQNLGKKYFPGSKWIAGNILCIGFFSIPEDAFILCIGFCYRFRKMLLEAEIIDSVFYVCHLRYIYIYTHMQYIYICVCFIYNMIPASHGFWSCLVVPPASAVKRPFTRRCSLQGFQAIKGLQNWLWMPGLFTHIWGFS